MVALILILAIGSYILIMFGLTFWLKRYHYYKERYYHTDPYEPAKPALINFSTDLKEEPDIITNPESSHCQKKQSEVLEKE